MIMVDPSDDAPRDPFNEMAVTATQYHEVYQTFLDVGFEKDQAFWFVQMILGSIERGHL